MLTKFPLFVAVTVEVAEVFVDSSVIFNDNDPVSTILGTNLISLFVVLTMCIPK